MNKKQIRIAWWGISLISITLTITGILVFGIDIWNGYYYKEGILSFIILTFIVPLALFFGIGIITAGIKK